MTHDKLKLYNCTSTTPVVIGRKYLTLYPVAGTIYHVQMSLSCCPFDLDSYRGGGGVVPVAETIMFPTVTYGSESWNVRNKQKEKKMMLFSC